MGNQYEITVWGDQEIVCAICGKEKDHGIGIEGQEKIDVDVCDDCAGCQVMLGVDAARIARQRIAQGEKLHEKIQGLRKKSKKEVKFVEERGGVLKVRTRGGKRKCTRCGVALPGETNSRYKHPQLCDACLPRATDAQIYKAAGSGKR